MARGDTFSMPTTILRDEQTGRMVHKLSTWDDCHCVATYFYYQPMTADERYLVFGSDRTGRFELYRLDLQAEQATQLTEHREDVDPSRHEAIWLCNVHPNGRELLYKDIDGLHAQDLYTFEDRLVCSNQQPELGQVNYGPNASLDGKTSVGWFKGNDGRCGLLRLELAGTDKPEVLYVHDDPEENVGHIVPATAKGVIASFNIMPDRQNTADETPRRRARAWRITDEGKAEPFLIMPPGFRATHEYWGPDGRLYCHKKTVGDWTPNWIVSIDGQTGQDVREHFHNKNRKLGHSFINKQGNRIVSDVQDETGNELYLINLTSGESEILCWPNSTVSGSNNQLSHVHPWFSPSGQHVGFSSDRSGKAAVFMVRDVE